MAESDKLIPTPREHSILQVLWKNGPSTVRQVHSELNKTEVIAYTSVLTTLQIMFGKGLVSRDTSRRSHVYQAVISEDETQDGVLRDVLSRVFGGSAARLVSRALAIKPASAEDLKALRAYVDAWGKDEA